MTEEQIHFLNNECNSICFSSGKDFSIFYTTLGVNNPESYRMVLEKLENKNRIKEIKFTDNSFDLSMIKDFEAIEILDNSSFNSKHELDLELLYQIYENFKNIKTIKFNKVDERVLEVYNQFNFKIETSDERYKIQSENELIKYHNKFELKRGNLNIWVPENFTFEQIDELISHCSSFNEIRLPDDDVEKAFELYNYLKNKNISVKTLIIKCENKNYNNLNLLESIQGDVNIIMHYGETFGYASLDEFLAMRASIEYYKSLIEAQNLSPIEKVMYAYDVIKSFSYSSSGKKATRRRREEAEIHSIIATGNIVCRGYTQILKQILQELGIKTTEVGIFAQQRLHSEPDQYDLIDPNRTGHARNLVRIDDEKYGIHGIFSLDATWDSNLENQSGLNLYRFFLIPPTKYNEVTPDDSYPKLYTYFWEMPTKDRVILEKRLADPDYSFDCELTKSLEDLFGTIEMTDAMKDYFYQTPNISYEQFVEILHNVRLAQGYTNQDFEKDVVFPLSMTNKVASKVA